MTRKRILLFAFVSILSLYLVACTSSTAEPNNNETDKDNNQGENTNDAEDKSSITIAVPAEPSTLLGSMTPDFPVASVIRNIYDRLVDYDGEGNFLPAAATEWKNIDELTWEFKLREGVTFHNGAPFNADSVKYTIEFMLDPDNNSTYGGRLVHDLEELKIIDEYTVQFITKKPMANFLNRAVTDFQFLEPGYVEEVGAEEAAKNPIGTGPYKLTEWKKGEYLKLEANEDYWKEVPSIKEATVRFMPEFSTRLSSLLSGDIDLIKGVPVDSMDRIEADDNSKILSGLTGKPSWISLNTITDSPLREEKVRQALNYGLDVDSLLENVLNGKGQRMKGTLTPMNLSYAEVEGYDYDPEKAVELIKEAGYEPEDITLKLNTTNGNYPMDSQVSQAVASELGKIGINIEIEQTETGVFLERLTSQKLDDMFFFTSAASTEGENFFSFFFTPTGTYRWVEDDILDEIKDSFGEFDPEKRQEVFADLQNRLNDAAYTIPLWIAEDIWGGRKDISFEPRYDESMEIIRMTRE